MKWGRQLPISFVVCAARPYIVSPGVTVSGTLAGYLSSFNVSRNGVHK